MLLSVRSLLVSAALVTSAASASAALVVPIQFLDAASVQAFSSDALDSFSLPGINVNIVGKGNASAVPNTVGQFSLPITEIKVTGLLHIAGGGAVGSALEISRTDRRGGLQGLTLANFQINYDTKQVLADATPFHGATTKQLPIYNFNTATPLGIRYKFPLSFSGHEVLNKLFFTPEAQSFLLSSLALPPFAAPILAATDFGTLTQDINIALRKKAISTKPYVPAP